MRVLFFLFLLAQLPLRAQHQIITVTTQLIVDKQYDEAHRYLDSILKHEPDNVDALMMKGNVVLNRDLDNQPPLTTVSPDDESIYTNSVSWVDKPVKVVPDTTLSKVETRWRQCLTIDSSRVDIIKGLCTLYAMALQPEKLRQEITKLVAREPDADGGQAYRIAEYARKVKERGNFDAAMEIYQFIARQYPKLAGIRCDIASEYFYEGQGKVALQWLDSAFALSETDETTYLNGAFIYSELGYFDNAQQVLDAYSQKYDRKLNQFYNGLRQFADATLGWYDVLHYFSDMVDSNAYFTEVNLARSLLPYRDSFTIKDYTALLQTDIPDYYKVFIHQRAVRQFRSSCEPYLQYGVFEGYLKNYPAAIQFYEEGEHCNMDTNQLPYWQLNYGYALYRTAQYEKSWQLFQPLSGAANRFIRQAAAYFTARILVAQQHPEQAKDYLKQIAGSTVRTKYVTLALQLQQQLAR